MSDCKSGCNGKIIFDAAYCEECEAIMPKDILQQLLAKAKEKAIDKTFIEMPVLEQIIRELVG